MERLTVDLSLREVLLGIALRHTYVVVHLLVVTLVIDCRSRMDMAILRSLNKIVASWRVD